MARYTYSFLVKLPIEDIHAFVNQVMPSCRFDMIYSTNDYLMARETPGNVSFTKLVTTEILIDTTMASNQGVKVNFVVKNDELPLQVNNHCHQLSEKVKDAICENKEWHLITVTTD
jgi:hypothetical protein